MLPEQEREFISALEAAAPSRQSRYDRDDVTALLNALRCGTTFATLVEVAPGARLARVKAAYRALDTKRAEAQEAWTAIEENPSGASLRRHAACASRLLPTGVHRVLAAMELSTHDAVAEAVAEVSAQVHRMHVIARGIESELTHLEPLDPRGIELGTKLHAAHTPGIYSHTFYLADRVASLSPTRVSGLLGEQLA